MAEKKKGFSISEYVTTEDVSNLDTAASPEADKIAMLSIDCICENEKNFYDTSNVAELINSIALNGLIEPIIVAPDLCDAQICNGMQFYRIISGHRRFKAYSQLNAEDSEKWAFIPAIIREPKNEIVEELLLIEANRATRVMSSADTMKQAERYTDLLSKLKESGVEIPGRLRDAVADAMGISASRLARLNVIRTGLCDEAMSMFVKNTLNESVSYDLAQAPVEMQKKILASSKEPEKMAAWQVENRARWLKNISSIKCKDGSECINGDRMFCEKCKSSNNYTYLQCAESSKCCKDCSKLFSCPSSCSKFADKIRKHKSEEKERKATEKFEAETKRLNIIAENNKQWAREAYARKQSGISTEEARKAMRELQCYAIPCDSAMAEYESGYCDDSYSANLLNSLRANELATLAKLYNCSADYLLGLTEELTPGAAPARWREYPVDPPQDGQHIITLKRLPTLELEIGQAICRDEKLFIYRPGTEDCNLNNENIHGWMPFPEV